MEKEKAAASLKRFLNFGRAGERKAVEKKAPERKPLYLYRPMETAFSYRIEFREGKGLIYRAWSSKLIYIIEGELLYRAGEEEAAFVIVDNRVYSVADRNTALARLENGKIWTAGTAGAPAYEIRDSIIVQGTL